VRELSIPWLNRSTYHVSRPMVSRLSRWSDISKYIVDFSQINEPTLGRIFGQRHTAIAITGPAGAGKSTFFLWAIARAFEERDAWFDRVVFLSPAILKSNNEDWKQHLLEVNFERTLIAADGLFRVEDDDVQRRKKVASLKDLQTHQSVRGRRLGPFAVAVTLRAEEYPELLRLGWNGVQEIRLKSDCLPLSEVLGARLRAWGVPYNPNELGGLDKRIREKSGGLPMYLELLASELAAKKERFNDRMLDGFPDGMVNLVWQIIYKNCSALNGDEPTLSILKLLSTGVRLSDWFLEEALQTLCGRRYLGQARSQRESVCSYHEVVPSPVRGVRYFTLDSHWRAALDEGVKISVGAKYSDTLNLVDGLMARFRTWKGGQLLETFAPLFGTQTIATMPPVSGNDPQSPTALSQSNVNVPKQTTDSPIMQGRVSSNRAKSNQVGLSFTDVAVIPFGGRRKFAVYVGPGGDYRILTSSEASINGNYTSMDDATISITDPAPNPTTGFNMIQLENERDKTDPSSSIFIRGTALVQSPCDKLAEIKEITPPLPCDGTKRKPARLQAALNGKVLVTRDVESQYMQLGKVNNHWDAPIAFYADNYGVPPHFLKSQAIRESGGFKSNFKFEFTSINLTKLAGDASSTFAKDVNGVVTANRLFQTEPWSHYMLGGTALGAYQNVAQRDQAQETQGFQYSAQNQGPVFELAVPVKRTVAATLNSVNRNQGVTPDGTFLNTLENAAQVTATIVTTDGSKPPVHLYQSHQDAIWQKKGYLKQPDFISPGQTLTPLQFAVNYDTGEVRLGPNLQPGQELVVNYWPVQDTGNGFTDNLIQTVVSVPRGDFIGNAPALPSTPAELATTVVKGDNGLVFAANKQGQSLFNFLQTNAPSGKAFLTTPGNGDRFIEFKVNQQNYPTTPRDPRYQYITAQPYASSSFGFLQFTLLAFDNSQRGTRLKAVFDPSKTGQELYQLLSHPEKNFSLAANFHRESYPVVQKAGTPQLCGMDDCTQAKWINEWVAIFREYNSNGAGYSPNRPEPLIVRDLGSQYEPKPVQ